MIEVEGLDELKEFLDSLIERLSSGRAWGESLGRLLKIGKRHAVSISPVVSGSYRDAHRVVVGDSQAELSIDPSARNVGVKVERYAASVEKRHKVYDRTHEELLRHLEGLAEEIVNGKRQ